MGQDDINATDNVSHIIVTYGLFPLKDDILIWYSW